MWMLMIILYQQVELKDIEKKFQDSNEEMIQHKIKNFIR